MSSCQPWRYHPFPSECLCHSRREMLGAISPGWSCQCWLAHLRHLVLTRIVHEAFSHKRRRHGIFGSFLEIQIRMDVDTIRSRIFHPSTALGSMQVQPIRSVMLVDVLGVVARTQFGSARRCRKGFFVVNLFQKGQRLQDESKLCAEVGHAPYAKHLDARSIRIGKPEYGSLNRYLVNFPHPIHGDPVVPRFVPEYDDLRGGQPGSFLHLKDLLKCINRYRTAVERDGGRRLTHMGGQGNQA